MTYSSFLTPLGDLTLFAENDSLVALEWGRVPEGQTTPLLQEARRQLLAYFSGSLKEFQLPLNPAGTAFQKSVWRQMQQIPYGQIESYGTVARKLSTSPRAVGGACGRNPLPVIIPCHRIIAGDGGLGGYSGQDGTISKAFLLRLEGASLSKL